MQLRSTDNELARLRELIRSMSRDSAIYKLLKEELSSLGYWRNKPRGKPNIANLRKANSTLEGHGHGVSIDNDW